MKAIKPIAFRISSWSPYTEVIYKCPRCDCSFASLGDKIKYCYNCGTAIDWNVIKKLKEPFSANMDNIDSHVTLINSINKENKEV